MGAFIYSSFHILDSGKDIVFRYLSNNVPFEDKIKLPKPIPQAKSGQLLQTILFNLHLALGISYWKLHCYSDIQIQSGFLSQKQAQFWNTVYIKGLGEFFFRNSIEFNNLVCFPYSKSVKNPNPLFVKKTNKELIGIGGGKDSLLTWELKKKEATTVHGFVVESNRSYETITQIAKVGNIPLLVLQRYIDSKALYIQDESVYKGHVPISMIYAWLGILAAYLYDYDGFVVSNEKSANEGNREWKGMMINHQWSKSEEFELMMQTYLNTYITPSIRYYSYLRSLSEIEIVRQFIAFKQYLPYVTSCNRNFSMTKPLEEGRRWCGACAKCAFSYLLFSAYLTKKEVVQMFGSDLLNTIDLYPTFLNILGKGKMKPFDCVGTFKEAKEALAQVKQKKEFIDSILVSKL